MLLSLWVLPGLVATLTPIRVREMFSLTRDALITAFVAGDLFIVLPALVEASRTLIARHAPQIAGRGRPARRAGARLVQLSAHRQAVVDQLHRVCGLVRGCAPGAPRLPATCRDRLADVLRQSEFSGAVPARPVPNSRRYLPVVPGHRRDQLDGWARCWPPCTRWSWPCWARARSPECCTCARVPCCGISRSPLRCTIAVIGGARALFNGYLHTEYSKDEVLGSMQLMRTPTASATVHRAASRGGRVSDGAGAAGHSRAWRAARGLHARRPPVLVLQHEGGPGRLRRRAGAPPGQRARRRRLVRACRPGAAGGGDVEELLRHRDGRCGSDDPARLASALLGDLPGRDASPSSCRITRASCSPAGRRLAG